NRHFSKENIQMAKKYLKRCQTSLVIMEMQIKTTMRYLFIPIRMTITKQNKTGNSKCWCGCGEIGTLIIVGGNVKIVRSLWKTVWKFLKKLNIELLHDPAILLL
ncbi:LORF2 protein, partial [Crocuta crocuta]